MEPVGNPSIEATEIQGLWSPWEILIWIAATAILGRWSPWEILQIAATEIRGRWRPWESLSQLIRAWIQRKNSCDIMQGKSHHDFCRESLGVNGQVYQEESGQMDRMQGISAIPTQEKKIQQRKGSHRRDKSEKTKGAEGADDTFFSPQKNVLFPDNRFTTHFFSMKNWGKTS